MSEAAAARVAYLGAQEAECVPWDELKPEVRERWERVADMAFSTATDLRNKLASANGKIERQAAELTKLYHLRQGDAGERMRLEADCAWNKQAADSLRAELDAVKAELAALRQPVESRPMKVRWGVTESEVSAQLWGAVDAEQAAHSVMDYLAAHAVIDVPHGVPSVEECSALAERSLCNAQLGGLGDGEQRYVVARDIRDAVLAGVAQDRESLVNALIEAKQQRDVLASKLLAQGVSVRDLYSDGDGKPFGGWHFKDGKIVPNQPLENIEELPTAAPTDAEVEALARVLEAAYPGHKTDYENMSESFKQARRAQARAAFAHIGARQGECQECAKWKSYGTRMEGNTRVLAKRIDKARAALEGD